MKNFDRLLTKVKLKRVTDTMGVEVFESTYGVPFAFCPLLWEDSGGGAIPEKLPVVAVNHNGVARGNLPLGYCADPGCRECPHLLMRIERTENCWVCPTCLDDMKPATFPGYFSHGRCDSCGEQSIVLQLVLLA